MDMNWLNDLQRLAVAYAPKVLLALATLVIGWHLIKVVVTLMDKAMTARDVEVTLRRFLESLVGTAMKAMLLISIASMVGIETTSFVAVLGAAGLAIGLALQGSLANFAGGVLILLFRPFKVGDFIQAQGESGVVKEIQIFTTHLLTGDNKRVIVPNGPLANGNITNFSAEERRRVDMVFGIGYGDSIDDARSVIQSVIASDARIFADPAPQIVVSQLADSSVNLTVRVWSRGVDYWDVLFATNENVKKAFDEKGITIPFPQREVTLRQS
ncbi:mechanosensitive ion channel family protein [Chitinibacteraceae bacterium HSL-7]